MAIEVFSFFSGLGFMDLGFEEAGFDIAFVNEYNHSFIQAYQYARRNRPHRPQCLYLKTFVYHLHHGMVLKFYWVID